MRRLVFYGLTYLRSQILPFVALLAIAAATGPAHAEGFFQSLFGFGSKPEAKAQSQVPPKPVASLRSLQRSRPAGVQRNQSESVDNEDDDEQAEKLSGPYRTVCVRACDGYYFPISPRASQSHFKRDAKMCNKMCGLDAKLYYMDRNSTDIDQLESVDGEPYSKLPQAYAYRKSLIDGCSCKPMPWADAEKSRHALYAVADQIAKSQRETFERELEAKLKVAHGGQDQDAQVEELSLTTKLHLVPGQMQQVAEIEQVAESTKPVQRKRERLKRRWVRVPTKPKRNQTVVATTWSSTAPGPFSWLGGGKPSKQ